MDRIKMSNRYICQCLLEMFRDMSLLLVGQRLKDPYIELSKTEIDRNEWWHKWHPSGIFYIRTWTSALEREDILTNMIHVILHSYNKECDIQDVASSTENFHTKLYAETAKKFGISCSYNRSRGFRIFEIPEDIVEEGMGVIDSYYAEIQTYLESYLNYKENTPEGKGNTYVMYQCPICKKKAKARENTHLICGVDNVPFERI